MRVAWVAASARRRLWPRLVGHLGVCLVQPGIALMPDACVLWLRRLQYLWQKDLESLADLIGAPPPRPARGLLVHRLRGCVASHTCATAPLVVLGGG